MPSDLPWLEPGDPFPAVTQAWGPGEPAPGLLAGGGALDPQSLERAYRHGIFPWFSEGQPILWWSPDPRMVLQTANFRVHRSLRQSLRHFVETPGNDLRMDTAFGQVIRACAGSARSGQSGTWIVPPMVAAYEALHAAGLAHSVEHWVQGELVGGLYCVAIGRAVFGESMFSRQSGASKIALAGLVAFCRAHGITQIDCQQNTRHLESLGAQEMPRQAFLEQVDQAARLGAPEWHFDSVYWDTVLKPPPLPR